MKDIESIKLRLNNNGKLLPCMPNGDFIPNISKGSISIVEDPILFSAGIVRVKMECLMQISDIESIKIEQFKQQIENK